MKSFVLRAARRTALARCIAGFGLLALGAAASPAATFGPGALLIPMDLGNGGADDGQDDEMLRPYGLVYALLRSGVPVHWAIRSDKLANGDDFSIVAGSVRSVRTSVAVTLPRAYRGGPFLIAEGDAAAALPIVTAWQAAAGDETEVHEIVTGSIDVEVARTLFDAPRIAILLDGNEAIAFNDLNAAGIPDSAGGAWSLSSPDLLTEAQVVGLSQANPADGALFFLPSGMPRYCFLASMHINATALTPFVVGETRSWLNHGPLTHAFFQCESTRAFESDASGHFLTTLGIDDDGSAAAAPVNRIPADPIAQIDGAIAIDSGSVDSMGLEAGSTFRPGARTLFNQNLIPLTERITLLTGRMDGVPFRGQVTYLGGHDYSLSLPVSANPQTNGVRFFLNALLASDCTNPPDPQADVELVKSGPPVVTGSEIGYTIAYFNPGPRPVENVRLRDVLPAGTAYVPGSGVPAPTSTAGGVLTWNLPTIGSGAVGNVTFAVSVANDGEYANTATVDFAHLTVHRAVSNTVMTVRDTVPPTIEIPGPPVNPVYTGDSTPTFSFSAGLDATVVECQFSPPANGFVPCSSPFTAPFQLPPLDYELEVRVEDAAGNPASATHDFTVDETAPTVTSVASVAASTWIPPQAAASMRSAITRILVTFDDPMSEAGAGSVTAISNWLLAAAGANLTLDTVDCSGVGGDDEPVPLAFVEYDSPSRTAALSEAGGLGLSARSYRLFACPTLESLSGAPLDGAADGGGPEAYVRDFGLLASPRVPNPNFDGYLSPWSPLGPAPSEWSHSPADAEGLAPFSGAAKLDTAAGAGATWYLEQCFDAAGSSEGRLSTLARIASSVPGAPTLRGTLTWYDGFECTGDVLGLEATPIRAGTSGGAWLPLATADLTPPAGATSALLSFRVQGGAASSYAVEIDRVLYPESTNLFADGFESGGTCSWSLGVGVPPC